ncbi:MAG: hypothetical protein AAFQ08_00930 [Bacteroidota bacterium]
MRKDIASFAAGVIVGTVLGILIKDEDKKNFQDALNKYAQRLRKDYEGTLSSSIEKLKKLVKTA